MIHISLVRTDIDDTLLARLCDALSASEQARAARFRQLADRRRHVVARTVLKGLLAERLACDARDVVLATGAHGKPLVDGACLSPGAPLHFSLSHSGDLALIALAAVPVGIDLERDTPTDAQTLAQAWFTPAEHQRLARGEDEFLTIWTAREAVLKAVGTGLSTDPRAFSTPALSTTPALPAFAAVQAASHGGEAGFDGYLVARLDLGFAHAIPSTLIAPYRAAIALRGAPQPVQLACIDAASFAGRVTLHAVSPASADAACLPH